ncbi:hypothetical protein BVX95_01395 [archaeon D22]|nr:hypothetical protein BVX95_01395 [archaeon D22]
MTYDIITVGSATLDVFADTDNEVIDIKTKKSDEKLIAYPLGSKILINELNFEIGGGGTNTAVCASRLGLKAGYLGSIGEDNNGKRVLDLLEEEEVTFLGHLDKKMTNYSVVLDSIDNDRTILVYKGASERFKLSKSKQKELSAKWFYFCAMVGDAYKELEKLSTYAKKNNIKIAFNPSSYLAEKGKKYLSKILKNTDMLILNKEEAELIVGRDDKESMAKDLSKLGPKNVVITDGKEEIVVLYNNSIKKYKPKKSKAKETTGAGDAFGSSLVSGLILKDDIDYAIKLAIKNSSCVVSKPGAKAGLIRLK